MSNAVPKRYDAFLSYNSQDRPAVKALAERLQGEGLILYLDEWDLRPGQIFQHDLAEALRDSKSCVVFLGPSGLAPWQKEEILVAVDRRAHDELFHVIPVLLPGTERPRRGNVAHLEFLINASWVEFLETLDDERKFRRLVWGIRGTKPESPPEPVDGVCPYRGLEAFRPEDERFFFGRDSLTGWLISALRSEVRAKSRGVRFLGVVGPSGSGKSSVALAGLVPKLKAGAIEGSERWPVAMVRPADEPLKNLATRVVPSLLAAKAAERVERKANEEFAAAPDPVSVHRLTDYLIERLDADDDAQALDTFARTELQDRPEDVRLLVVVDQFEELFTYRPADDRARERFERRREKYLANLLNAAAAPGGRVVVIITMRSDFLSKCAIFTQLSAVLSDHQELVGPMTPAEMREAIVKPAYLVGHEVESGLVERLLADVKGQTGALPLLQFALTEVWKKRDVRRLTLRAYDELGRDDQGKPRGIEGALEHRASEIYSKLSPVNQDLCRRIFLRLVQPGEGTGDTKRRVSYRELLPTNPERAEAVRKLIYLLSEREARLITTGDVVIDRERESRALLSEREARLITTEGADSTDGWVEVAHEALIQGWTQLRQWVDADRAGLRTQRRLTEAAQEWATAKPEDKDGYLYKGAPLAVCREWVKLHADEIGSIEAEFLDASERREQETLENERRLREAAEAVAKRMKRLSRRLLAAATVAVVLAGTSGVLAWRANEARKDADSRRIALQSVVERGHRLDLSLILAVEALRSEDTYEARTSLFDALHDRPRIASFLWTAEVEVESVASSPDGKTVAAGYRTSRDPPVGGVVLCDVPRRKQLADMRLADAEGLVTSVAFSPDGKTLAAGYSAPAGLGGVVLCDSARLVRLPGKPLSVAEGYVTGVAFSPDGKTLAAGYSASGDNPVGGVVLWNVASRDRLAGEPFSVLEGKVKSVAFRPQGGLVAAGYDGGGGRGGVVVWDATARTRLAGVPMAVGEGSVKSVAFTGDGKALAAGYGDPNGTGGVAFWDVPQRKRLTEKLGVIEGQVTSLASSRDGRLLAAGYASRGVGGFVLCDAVRLRRLPGQPLAISEGYVEGAAFSPDSKTLALAYGEPGRLGGLMLCDLSGRQRLADRRLAEAEGPVTSVGFSPDGKTLAAGYSVPKGGAGVVLWDVVRRERLDGGHLTVDGDDISSVTFSPVDGKTLAARFSGGIALWNVDRRERLVQPLPVDEGLEKSLALSPDGKTLAAGYRCGVVLWDVDRRQWLADKLLLPAEGDVLSIAFSPDGRTLGGTCSVLGRSELVLWEVASRRRLVEEALPIVAGEVTSVTFSPDGRTLAVGCDAGVELWDSGRRKWVADEPLRISEGQVTTLTFSPNGRMLAAGYGQGGQSGIVLWDTVLGQPWVKRMPPPELGGRLSNLAVQPRRQDAGCGIQGRHRCRGVRVRGGARGRRE